MAAGFKGLCSNKKINAVISKINYQNAMTKWLKRLSNYYSVAVVTIDLLYIIGLSGTILTIFAWTDLTDTMFGR
jgi:hypothetical protein